MGIKIDGFIKKPDYASNCHYCEQWREKTFPEIYPI
jgi:hypothetical protein